MVLTGIAGVLGGILVFVIVANLVGSRADTTDSPAATFDVGPAESRARTIAKGGPILFQDLLNNSRDIYVQHLGGDDWRAFEAHAPGAPRRCFLEWRVATREFVDGCDGRTFPADGTGLASYPARVDERKHVVVDLRTPATTTIPTTTTSTAAPPTSTSEPATPSTTVEAPPPA
ncbi:MAG: hypothetical protein QOG43_983 [Actinomycetota bacterium]|nr:hypothetical protein [Actinomycetota bacterium]